MSQISLETMFEFFIKMNSSPNNEEHESENLAQSQIVNTVDDQRILNRIIAENEIQ